MTISTLRRGRPFGCARPRVRRCLRLWFATATLMVFVAGCGLLDVSDPTLVQDSDLANAAGANALRLSAAEVLSRYASQLARQVALISDEATIDTPYPESIFPERYLDSRESERFEQLYGPRGDPYLGVLDEIVTRAAVAIPAVRAYTPTPLRGEFLAQLFALRGVAIIQMAEDVCSGFPINDVRDNLSFYSEPYTTDAALISGVAQLDSALAHGQDSVRFLDLARVAKGRALLDLGQYAQAAAAVAPVPTTFSYAVSYPDGNWLYFSDYGWQYGNPVGVGNREGGTGLPFATAQDPRVSTAFKQVRYSDPTDSLYDQLKYLSTNAPFVVATGVEARLIEAEAALHASDPNWLAILNTLRQTQVTPALPDTTDPGTDAARVDLIYRERAFWLYLTGRRLGDLRRLIRNYGRAPEAVFPTGSHPLEGGYGTATAIPFVQRDQQQFNPHITSGCTTR